MAVYKNREVEITSYVTNESPVVEIRHQNGDREMVNLREVQFTEQEKKTLSNDQTTSVDNVAVIKDKDLQALRDSQDAEKIEKRQANEGTDVDVPVSRIKVNADEVRNASVGTSAAPAKTRR